VLVQELFQRVAHGKLFLFAALSASKRVLARAKSKALHEAMQFLVSGEFVGAFEEAIAKAAISWTR
jgi:integral membrane sensor domain MASE1